MIGGDLGASGISAVLLFGSRARGDNERGSDTDILLVSPPGDPRHKSSGHLSMFFYPWPKLLDDARAGDLFVCHLTREAQPIFDPTGRLEELRAAFRLRSSYAREVQQASDVGWLIDRCAEQLSLAAVARRMVWCVRTILIARSAEHGEPVFAPARLAASTPSAAARFLLASRHQRRADAVMRHRFRQFLSEHGDRPRLPADADLSEYEARFVDSDNAIGLRMLRSRRKADEAYF